MTAKEFAMLSIGVAMGSMLFITINNSKDENVRQYCSYLQERRTTDSLTIRRLRKQLLYADTVGIETTIVDGSIVKQRYRKGDSVLRVW